jgi:hypothetical protein
MAARVHRPLKVIAFNANDICRQRYELSKQLQNLHIVFKSRRGHELWDVVCKYRETTTYCSDIQAFIVVISYTDGLTARLR